MNHDLESDRALLDRLSRADQVADILRTRVLQGYFPPGERLAEGAIGSALGVSRNTLREAFRLLTHEGLLVQELNRGVFVRVPTVDDVVDIYRVRKLVECQAVRGSTRIDALMQRLLAELRLVFHVMADPRRFHEPYLARNRELFELIRAGDGPGTERALGAYLDDAERQLVQAYTDGRRAWVVSAS